MLADGKSAFMLVLGLCIGLVTAACTFDIALGPKEADGGSGGTEGDNGGSGGGGSGGSEGGSGGTLGGFAGSDGGAGGSSSGPGGSSGSGGGGTAGSSGSTNGSGGMGGGAGGEGCLPPMHAVCDTVTQCGCDSGENCHFQLDRGDPVRVCLPVGSAGPNSSCSENADCALGYGCVDEICKQYCHTAGDCGWEDASCEPVEVHDEPAHPEWNVCTRHCDVVAPSDPSPGFQACRSGATCVPLFESETTASSAECAPAGDGAADQPCSDDSGQNDPPCGPGLTCEFGRCLKWCDLAVSECPDDLPCVAYPFPTGLTVTDRNLGVCFDGVLQQDDFTDDELWPWVSSSRPLAEAGAVDGTYFIWLFWHRRTFATYAGVDVGDVVVEADARSDRPGNWPLDLAEQALGVYCRDAYLFQVRLNGSARILAYDYEPEYGEPCYCDAYDYECYYECYYQRCICDAYDYDCYYECTYELYGYDPDPWVPLTDWVSSDAIRPTEVNHIAASCVGNSPVLLTLYVNGQHVLQLEESVYSAPSGGVGLLVSSFDSGVRGEFDNLFVWEP